MKVEEDLYALIIDRRWICNDLLGNSFLSYDEIEKLRQERQDLKRLDGKDLTVYQVTDGQIKPDDICVLVDPDNPSRSEYNLTIIGSAILPDSVLEEYKKRYGSRLKRLQPIGSLF